MIMAPRHNMLSFIYEQKKGNKKTLKAQTGTASGKISQNQQNHDYWLTSRHFESIYEFMAQPNIAAGIFEEPEISGWPGS